MSMFAQPCLFMICILCSYKSPRYQVSVYRTIGPLVSLSDKCQIHISDSTLVIKILDSTCLKKPYLALHTT